MAQKTKRWDQISNFPFDIDTCTTTEQSEKISRLWVRRSAHNAYIVSPMKSKTKIGSPLSWGMANRQFREAKTAFQID